MKLIASNKYADARRLGGVSAVALCLVLTAALPILPAIYSGSMAFADDGGQGGGGGGHGGGGGGTATGAGEAVSTTRLPPGAEPRPQNR